MPGGVHACTRGHGSAPPTAACPRAYAGGGPWEAIQADILSGRKKEPTRQQDELLKPPANAARICVSAMEHARTRVSTLKEEGNGKLKSGDLEQAVALYRQAAAEAALLPPEELASVWSNLALALLKQGSAAESLVAADKCIAAKPEWHKAHYRRGDALFHLRRYPEAHSAYARAQELAADDREVAAALALTAEAVQGGVWFRQLLPGREFAVQPSSPMEQLIFGAARQMQNHVYVVGCATSRECYVVDSCWDTDGIAAFARRNKMRLVGAIGTHYHFDHCGGEVPPQMAAMVAGPFGGKAPLPG